MTPSQKNRLKGHITLSGMSRDVVRDEIMRIVLSKFDLKKHHITGGFVGTGNKLCRDFITMLLYECVDYKQKELADMFEIDIAMICRGLKQLPYTLDNKIEKKVRWDEVYDAVERRFASYANKSNETQDQSSYAPLNSEFN